MLISLSYFSLLQKCKAIEIFILNKFESGRDGLEQLNGICLARVYSNKSQNGHKSV